MSVFTQNHSLCADCFSRGKDTYLLRNAQVFCRYFFVFAVVANGDEGSVDDCSEMDKMSKCRSYLTICRLSAKSAYYLSSGRLLLALACKLHYD